MSTVPREGGCELCSAPGGTLVWSDARLRVVRVDDPLHPGFMRVIWAAHVAEMTDLSAGERAHLMEVVYAVEAALRELLRPDKINLASLGNMTPHLHWHVIARYRGDPHFPDPVWAAPRGGAPVPLPLGARALEAAIAQRLGPR